MIITIRPDKEYGVWLRITDMPKMWCADRHCAAAALARVWHLFEATQHTRAQIAAR